MWKGRGLNYAFDMATVYNALCVKLLQSLHLSRVYLSPTFGCKEIESEQKVYILHCKTIWGDCLKVQVG